MSTEAKHVVIVGGSWAGLAAAMQLGRARRRVLIVDGGQPRNRFAHASHGYLGQDGVAPALILETFRAQVLAYPTVELRTGIAQAASQSDGGFTVTLGDGESVRAERVILATGVIDELPSIPGLAERWGRSVAHCPYCHGYEVSDLRLGVLASGEQAMHQAMLLPDWSADVTLFTNGAFAPNDEELTKLARRGVRIESRPVEELVGSGTELSGVRVRDGDVVPLDTMFVQPRVRLASDLAEQLGCAIDEGPMGPMIRTDGMKETTVKNVFSAGDAARAPHSATFAAADGAMAGMAAHRSLIFG